MGCDDSLGRDRLVGLERLDTVGEMAIWIAGRAGFSCRALSSPVVVHQHSLGLGYSDEAFEREKQGVA